MATYRIFDKADEFRIELVGRFGGACVHELRTAWQEGLRKTRSQRFTVDLARMSGWDAEGRKLLRDMYQHGSQFAAGNAEALVFLREISTPVRRGTHLVQPMLVQDGNSVRREHATPATPKPLPKAAGR